MNWQLAILICTSWSVGFVGVHADDADFRPIQDQLPVAPPADALVLFDGNVNRFRSMSGGEIEWATDGDSLVSTTGGNRVNHIASELHFRDAEIHVEFATGPTGGGNSGVYLHGHYELQIFNSFGKEQLTEHDQGALYGFAKPLVNASRPPGEWQVYDIHYRAPRRDAEGNITEQGIVTAWLNGQQVLDCVRFGEPKSVYHPFRYGRTPYLDLIATRMKQTQTGPLFLQDHDSPARFRNVWVRPLDEHAFWYDPANE